MLCPDMLLPQYSSYFVMLLQHQSLLLCDAHQAMSQNPGITQRLPSTPSAIPWRTGNGRSHPITITSLCHAACPVSEALSSAVLSALQESFGEASRAAAALQRQAASGAEFGFSDSILTLQAYGNEIPVHGPYQPQVNMGEHL